MIEQTDPLARQCPRCHAPAGAECRNYKGQRKCLCKQRAMLALVVVKPLVQRTLFDDQPLGGRAQYKED